MPASAYKPRDKALVENAVRIVYTRIYAKIRGGCYYTLEELNAAIKIALEEPGGDSALAQRMPQIAADGQTVVEAVELTKRFGAFTATDRVSFAVKRGEIFGLLGPNGAGKSTTFRMMCGLLTPTAGSAHVMGIDLKKSPTRARQRLGYMAQKFSLYGSLTVEQNLRFFSGVYGLQGARQREAEAGMVEVFKLGPFSDHTGDTALGFQAAAGAGLRGYARARPAVPR